MSRYKLWCSSSTSSLRYHLPSSSATLAPQLFPYNWIVLLFVLFCLQDIYHKLSRWLRPPKPLSVLEAPAIIGTLNEPPITPVTRPSLPPELIARIADFLFQPNQPTPNSSGAATTLCVKPLWQDVAGFMAANINFHKMGYRRWLQIISAKNVDDWDVVAEHIELIREIHCFDGTLLDIKHQDTLAKIPHLYAATIDAHSDVWHDEHNRFAYRDVLSALPPTLKRLEIENAHGPDIRIISLVKKYCPNLEELILGRCTMFNRSPACDFWESFPHDHDAYMSNTGTDEYAHSLAGELAPLRHLRFLRVGLYFVPSDIVLAHKLYHRRGLPAPEIIHWQSAIPLAELPAGSPIQELTHVDPATTSQLVSLLHRRDEDSYGEFKCPRCVEVTDVTSREAENSASSILREYLPKLTSVEWMGWLTAQHLGVHSYRFSP